MKNSETVCVLLRLFFSRTKGAPKSFIHDLTIERFWGLQTHLPPQSPTFASANVAQLVEREAENPKVLCSILDFDRFWARFPLSAIFFQRKKRKSVVRKRFSVAQTHVPRLLFLGWWGHESGVSEPLARTTPIYWSVPEKRETLVWKKGFVKLKKKKKKWWWTSWRGLAPDAEYWIFADWLVIGSYICVLGYRCLSDIRCWILDVGYWMLDIVYWSQIAVHKRCTNNRRIDKLE